MKPTLKFNRKGKLITATGEMLSWDRLLVLFLESSRSDTQSLLVSMAKKMKDQFGEKMIANYGDHPMYPIILGEKLTDFAYEIIIADILRLIENRSMSEY
ncbi:MAG: hypothetical protein P4L51_05545 [Puia sp.]|nr:hypothetical protein [Puia sp.]